MKNHLKYGLSALVMMCASVASAADDKPRFESNGFLQSLDVFMAEQLAKQRAAIEHAKAKKVSTLDLTLSGQDNRIESGFLSLDDSRPVTPSKPSDISERPDFSSLLSPDGAVRGSYGQDIFGASSRMGVRFGANPDAVAGTSGFEVALQSNYRMSMQGLSSTFGFSDIGLAEISYKAGLSLGYSGFGIDASWLRQTSLFTSNMQGYEAGFSYRATSWSARIAMSEYSEGADLIGIENEMRNIISFELGANYRLTDRVGLTGGVRYHDYGSSYIANPEQGEKSQMIFLGGRLRF
jgi:hypothetical protein